MGDKYDPKWVQVGYYLGMVFFLILGWLCFWFALDIDWWRALLLAAGVGLSARALL